MCDIFPIENPSIVVFPFENPSIVSSTIVSSSENPSHQQLTIPSTTNQTTNQQTTDQPENWNEMMTQHMVPAHVSQKYLEQIGFYSDEGSMYEEPLIEEPAIEEPLTKQTSIKQNPIKQPVAQKRERERGNGNQTFEQMEPRNLEPRDPKEVRDELGEKLGVSLVTRRRYEENIRPNLLNGEDEPVLVIEKGRGNSRARGILELFEDGSKAFVFTEVLPGTTYGGLLVIVAETKDGVIPTLNAIATAYNQLAGLRGAKSAPQHFFGNDYQNDANFIQFKALLGCKERKSSNKKKAKLDKE